MTKKQTQYTVVILAITIMLLTLCNSSGSVMADSYSTNGDVLSSYSVLKTQYPEFLTRLKAGWPLKSDGTEVPEEEKDLAIEAFLIDLDTQTKLNGPLDEKNIDSVMYEQLKEVIYWPEHRSVFRAMLVSYDEEITYVLQKGALHPNLIPLRDAVAESVLTREVISIHEVDFVNAGYGMTFDQLALPGIVEVVTTNQTVEEPPAIEDLPVIWENSQGAYQGEIGTYEFTGTLNLSEYSYLQPTTEKAKITVKVLPVIENVSFFEPIEVIYGKSLDEVALPSVVKVILSDGTIKDITVNWNRENALYDSLIPGYYTIDGHLDIAALKDLVYTAGEDLKVSASIKVNLPNYMFGGGKSIIIEDKAYYVTHPALEEALQSTLDNTLSGYVKLGDGVFIDSNGNLVDISEIPQVIYYFSNEITGTYSSLDGQLLN